MNLARKWPNFMTKWETMEREMSQLGYTAKIALKFKILTTIIMLLAISMYYLYIFYIYLRF